MEILGIDCGNVITDRRAKEGGTGLDNADTFMGTPYTPGIIAALVRLNTERFGGRVHVVSKCGSSTQLRTRQFLERKGFFPAIGVPGVPVHFCTTRKGKAFIAQRLGLTHFVDDRLEVLGYLRGIVPNLYLFNPNDTEVGGFRQHLPYVSRVENAEELVAAIQG